MLYVKWQILNVKCNNGYKKYSEKSINLYCELKNDRLCNCQMGNQLCIFCNSITKKQVINTYQIIVTSLNIEYISTAMCKRQVIE